MRATSASQQHFQIHLAVKYAREALREGLDPNDPEVVTRMERASGLLCVDCRRILNRVVREQASGVAS